MKRAAEAAPSREFSPTVSVWWLFQLDFACMFSGLRANSLELRAENLSSAAGNFMRGAG
jgi:hypothetical protein